MPQTPADGTVGNTYSNPVNIPERASLPSPFPRYVLNIRISVFVALSLPLTVRSSFFTQEHIKQTGPKRPLGSCWETREK